VSDDFVNIEVNGKPVKAKKGEVIIRATDRLGPDAYVPRFCYHEKLNIAANCRMCLVDVEKAPKPLPACATPVAEGMKIFTRSPRAIGAQRATMEFLLINHPLDCPICDQGGECELQDLAVGFGRDISRFNERKRAVPDENLGSLIATDMTRCIHCTRCIRFTEEIAGFQELGMIGRGENMKVRVALEQTVNHELSGNVIDLCPVGALVSKPYRFSARAWEMTSHPLVAPHDGVGTNVFAHVLRGKLMRVVPRENESINETWIADRDRFSYEALYSPERLLAPMVREGGEWKQVDWETALKKVADGLREQASSTGSSRLGVLANASSTTEELFLLKRLAKALGTANIDHRVRQRDVRDQAADPLHPSLGVSIADVESLDSLLLVGCNVRREAPMLAHRVRKAARKGAKVSFLNPAKFDYLFPVASYFEASSGSMVADLAAVLSAVGGEVPAHLTASVQAANPTDAHRALAEQLKNGAKKAIILGALATRHSGYADIRALTSAIAQATGASLGVLAEGANAAGAYLAGAVPHRDAGGASLQKPGLSAQEMLREKLDAYVLFGGVEPWVDVPDSETARALGAAKFVVAMTPFQSEQLRNVAHVMLPIGTFAETSGTYVNLEGTWQSFAGAVAPQGEGRPGWKVLRVLGNLLHVEGFDYVSSEDVLKELRGLCGDSKAAPYAGSHKVNGAVAATVPLVDINMYQADALVRRAPSLQKTREGRTPAAQY
jgi:NADH-quinone oxidoreductase subunit G